MTKRIFFGPLGLILVLLATVAMVACEQSEFKGKNAETQKSEQLASEIRQQTLIGAVPVPIFTTSQERINLVKRAETWNQENKLSFITLISFGKVMGTFPVSGKVSSVNSALTTPNQIIELRGEVAVVVESPQEDGSYGTNGDAIFWFTPEGFYMEWNDAYFLSDSPITIEDVPTLIYDATADFGGTQAPEAPIKDLTPTEVTQ